MLTNLNTSWYSVNLGSFSTYYTPSVRLCFSQQQTVFSHWRLCFSQNHYIDCERVDHQSLQENTRWPLTDILFH
jgi:hypothetical protein